MQAKRKRRSITTLSEQSSATGPKKFLKASTTPAELLKAMGRPFDEVIAMYLRASDAVPSRAEALHAASRLCRENRKFADGFEYARRGLKIPQPAAGLFVQSWVYDYGFLDEFAINAYWTGRYAELCGCLRPTAE